jgi:hypothetical protein
MHAVYDACVLRVCISMGCGAPSRDVCVRARACARLCVCVGVCSCLGGGHGRGGGGSHQWAEEASNA